MGIGRGYLEFHVEPPQHIKLGCRGLSYLHREFHPTFEPISTINIVNYTNSIKALPRTMPIPSNTVRANYRITYIHN